MSNEIKPGDMVWLGPDRSKFLVTFGHTIYGGDIVTVKNVSSVYLELDGFEGANWPCEPFEKVPSKDAKPWPIPGRKTIDINEMARHIEAITGEEATLSQLYRYARSLGFKLEITVEKIDG